VDQNDSMSPSVTPEFGVCFGSGDDVVEAMRAAAAMAISFDPIYYELRETHSA
jgi:hypothetical protein